MITVIRKMTQVLVVISNYSLRSETLSSSNQYLKTLKLHHHHQWHLQAQFQNQPFKIQLKELLLSKKLQCMKLEGELCL